jgi:hypothetical protein
MEDQELLSKISQWQKESQELRSSYDTRWAKNLKLMKGQFSDEELNRSKVRKRSKIFFRKTFATIWRLMAAFFTMFMRDLDMFKIEARGPEDEAKAGVLQKMVEYRRDVMFKSANLFMKFIWALNNIATMGWCVGKLHWVYDPYTKEDAPEFVLYPNEQVFPDLSAESVDKMRYIILESYLSKEDMEDMGYENVDKATATAIPNNIVRTTRYIQGIDPVQNPGPKEYPTPGRYDDQKRDSIIGAKYVVWEAFYKKQGTIYYCVTNSNNVVLRKAMPSPYGNRFPIIMGQCLTEPHKLIGEGFPELLEGPQESFNTNLNMRKDNLSLALNKMHIVNRFANVDLESLVNSRAGGIVMADDATQAVMPIDHPDVTQSSYMEANADEGMMQEMSGVTDIQMGQEKSDKATVAQLNYSNSSAKIDFYSAIVGETFFKQFYSLLSYLIQKFETDLTVFRVANDSFKKDLTAQGKTMEGDIYDLNFDADCTLRVGYGTVSRDIEVRNLMLAWDRAMMSNQAMVALAQAGGIPPEGMRLFDSAAFAEELFPMIGRKNVEKFFIKINQGQIPTEAGGQVGGAMQPQMGSGQTLNSENALQAGSMGGI